MFFKKRLNYKCYSYLYLSLKRAYWKGKVAAGNAEGNIRTQSVIITVQVVKRKVCIGKKNVRLAYSSGGKILKTVKTTLKLNQGYYEPPPESYREDF